MPLRPYTLIMAGVLLKTQIMKIHREGTNILILLFIVLAVLNVPIWLFMPPVLIPACFSVLSAIVYCFVFNFFRCPQRHYRGERMGMVVSSVDGRVVTEKCGDPVDLLYGFQLGGGTDIDKSVA